MLFPMVHSDNSPHVLEIELRRSSRILAQGLYPGYTKNKAPANAPAAKAAAKTSTTTQRKPAEEPKKDDSKVGSILKKTGRILKKPFKF